MDRVSDGIFNSTLGRRTLLLFILSALAPMLTFYFVTSYQVNALFQTQQKNELRQSSKNFGLLIFERLSQLNRSGINILNDVSTDSEDFFNNIIQYEGFSQAKLFNLSDLSSPPYPSWANQYKKLLDQSYKDNLSNGVLITDISTLSHWLVYRIQTSPDNRLLALKISNDYLWDGLSIYDLTKVFTIYSHEGQQLFQSISEEISTDGLHSKNQSESWDIVFSTLKSSDTWTIKTRSIKGTSFLKQTEFETFVQLLTLLAILLASFISVHVIQKNLKPIQALIQGIKDINANKFDKPVKINSGDEFEKLGDTFNSMSAKLGRHIKAMNALSSIDQLILNRLKIEDIVEIVITQGTELLHAKAIYFFIADSTPENYRVFSNNKQQTNIILSPSSLHLLHHPNTFNRLSELTIHQDLVKYFNQNSTLYSSVMWQEETAKAIIIAEFDYQPDNDIAEIADSFTDHINVALSNADWEERLFQQAHYDLLTGLPNRYLFEVQLNQIIEQASKSNQKMGLFFIDVDKFKTVNDTYGHLAGDKLLQDIATRFNQQNDSGTAYRLGGDEFVVIYNCSSVDKNQFIKETNLVAENILDAASKPIYIDDVRISTSVSIGIAVFPDDSDSADELLKFSDNAMYQAKAEGKNCYRYYSDIDNQATLDREEAIAEFHRALADDEFELYYQPKINLSTGIMDGCEALIRWNHPNRGLVMPGLFIPLAENYGLINDIGRWVIKTAAKQQVEWMNDGLNIGRIAVNVSVLQLTDKNFYDDVIHILNETGCSAKFLEFEITETAYTNDLNDFKDIIINLKETGLIFSVDDYGTGFSSLSLLLNLPIDKIKIDKSFIDNIESDKVSFTIVESTIKLAKEMGLSVVAEGVENAGQVSLLMESHCDSIQGYFFQRPLPKKQLAESVYKQYNLEAIGNFLSE